MKLVEIKGNQEHLVIEVCEAFNSMKGTEEKILEYLKDDKNRLLVCVSPENVIMGYTMFYETRMMMYIHHIEVLEEFRRQGYATIMIAQVKNICKIYGIKKLFLFTKEDNLPACNLYRKTAGKITCNDKLTFEYDI